MAMLTYMVGHAEAFPSVLQLLTLYIDF